MIVVDIKPFYDLPYSRFVLCYSGGETSLSFHAPAVSDGISQAPVPGCLNCLFNH